MTTTSTAQRVWLCALRGTVRIPPAPAFDIPDLTDDANYYEHTYCGPEHKCGPSCGWYWIVPQKEQ